MTTRSRKERNEYRKHKGEVHSKTECIFCDIQSGHEQFVSDTKSFKIIRNIFPYSYWDDQEVKDHLMVIPKRHIDSLSKLSANEAVEFLDIVGSYESRGYNVWARAPQSIVKSVVHQHTHLIEPGVGRRKFILYIRKPHLRFTR